VSPLNLPNPDPSRPTRAKIVATLGPASSSPDVIARLIEGGVSVFRLNFSHGSLDDQAPRLQHIRTAARTLRSPVAVLGDLPGPKIRVGAVPEGGIHLRTGQDVLIRHDERVARQEQGRVVLSCTYEPIGREVAEGHRVLIDDGRIRLLATHARQHELLCTVTNPGRVSSGKGINLPDSDISAPPLADRDWRAVEWSIEHGVDYLAMSFVRSGAEVRQLQERLAGICPLRADAPEDADGARIPVIAKIERPQALANIDDIVEAADAVMVARGDLGVEMDIARVPIAQKRIIAACAHWGRPCIVATQMLESMITEPLPTRAEATDVAGAIWEGADALMLSGETAVGHDPVLVVDTMRRIVAMAEIAGHAGEREPNPPSHASVRAYRTAALAHGAWHVARDMNAALIACWSQRGGTARYLSQNDFRAPILAWTSERRWARRMALYKNVTPVRSDPPDSRRLADWTDMVERLALERGLARDGDVVVLLAGKPLGIPKATSAIAILRIGETGTGFRTHDT